MTIGDWMESPQGAKITGYAFGFGAAVVIVGALFKIMHWPGASVVLISGMGTEALLFCITAFGNPHPTYKWDNVFPQLTHENEEEPMGLAGLGAGVVTNGNISSGSSSNQSATNGNNIGGQIVGGNLNIGEVNSLSEEDLKKLNEGISKLSETAEQLSKLSETGKVAETFVANMNNANSSLEMYSSAQNQINEATSSLIDSYKGIASDIATAKENTNSFVGIMTDVNKKLSSTNSSYELQIKALEAANAEVEAYKSNTTKLNSHVTELNLIYGNMLNALA